MAFTQETNSPFVDPRDPLLNMRSSEVPLEQIGSEETQSLIQQMYEIAGSNRQDIKKRSMVGLAAPQIGVLKRIILVDIGIDSKKNGFGSLVAYVNPEITWYSPEQEEQREGCFSVDSHILGIVPRSRGISLKAFDSDGHLITQDFSGFTARIIQHEVDHLDGIRFPDRIGKGILHWVEEEEYPLYREQWRTWPHLCPWEDWLSSKEAQ